MSPTACSSHEFIYSPAPELKDWYPNYAQVDSVYFGDDDNNMNASRRMSYH